MTTVPYGISVLFALELHDYPQREYEVTRFGTITRLISLAVFKGLKLLLDVLEPLVLVRRVEGVLQLGLVVDKVRWYGSVYIINVLPRAKPWAARRGGGCIITVVIFVFFVIIIQLVDEIVFRSRRLRGFVVFSVPIGILVRIVLLAIVYLDESRRLSRIVRDESFCFW